MSLGILSLSVVPMPFKGGERQALAHIGARADAIVAEKAAGAHVERREGGREEGVRGGNRRAQGQHDFNEKRGTGRRKRAATRWPRLRDER